MIGAQTQGLNGKQPANMAGLKKGGCSAVSNANAPFEDDDVVHSHTGICCRFGHDRGVAMPKNRKLLKMAVCMKVLLHRVGLPMIPTLAETVAIAKYLLMIEATGVRAHFGLLSCGASVELIQQAKAKGLPVTCDVAMHQLHLTDQIT